METEYLCEGTGTGEGGIGIGSGEVVGEFEIDKLVVYPWGAPSNSKLMPLFADVLAVGERVGNAMIDGNKYMLKVCIREYMRLREDAFAIRHEHGRMLYTIGDEVDECVGGSGIVVMHPFHFELFNESSKLIGYITERIHELTCKI
jgi:hypothetical protein